MGKVERQKAEKVKAERVKIERPPKPPRGMHWPDFDSMFMPDGDPLDGFEPSGEPEADGNAVMEVTKTVFIENERGRLDDYRSMIDPEFYLVVCFQSRGQKELFLDKSGLAARGVGDKYLNGLQLAQHFGVDVEPVPLQTKNPRLTSRALRDVKTLPKGGES